MNSSNDFTRNNVIFCSKNTFSYIRYFFLTLDYRCRDNRAAGSVRRRVRPRGRSGRELLSISKTSLHARSRIRAARDELDRRTGDRPPPHLV